MVCCVLPTFLYEEKDDPTEHHIIMYDALEKDFPLKCRLLTESHKSHKLDFPYYTRSNFHQPFFYQSIIKMENEDERNAEDEKSPSPTPNSGQAGKVGAKKPTKKKERGRRNREICDVFGDAAMSNAYYICHNVQDFLYCRGFPWNASKK
ncbi:unnamed protein product [Orchesella dallaii]|uniref:Uncharacterized protein n=1 Tax=Orchesella dallaii TaxID=48710 RepID=A0ABP1RXA2_9HEXA